MPSWATFRSQSLFPKTGALRCTDHEADTIISQLFSIATNQDTDGRAYSRRMNRRIVAQARIDKAQAVFGFHRLLSTRSVMSALSPQITISSLQFLKPQQLKTDLASTDTKVAVVDVRDEDHIGGHIRGSQWVPSAQLEARIPELLRLNADKDKVIFHCMHSQQRGPRAALTYARAKARDTEKQTRSGTAKPSASSDPLGGQRVCVLEGGFGSWQQSYGDDASVTEAYQKDLWEPETV